MANEGNKPPKAAFVTALRITLRSGATAEAKRLFNQVHQKLGGGDQRYWTYYAQLGPGETYLVVAPGANLKVFDGKPAGGQVGGNADEVLSQLEATFAQHERVLLEYLPEFSNHPDREGDAPGPLLFHTRLTLKPGATAALKTKLQKLTEHHVKAGSSGRRFWTYGTVAGGNERAYHVVTPFQSYDELTTTSDNTDISRIHENDLTDIDSHIETIERTVLEYLPGFSNPPA
jgi:hypothetical protein